MWQEDAWRMIQRRAVGIETSICNHTFRSTGITAYLKNKGALETTLQIANHESPRTFLSIVENPTRQRPVREYCWVCGRPSARRDAASQHLQEGVCGELLLIARLNNSPTYKKRAKASAKPKAAGIL